MEKERKKRRKGILEMILLVGLFIFFVSLNFVFAADPDYVDSIDYGVNETKGASSSLYANVSGGYLSHFNLTTTVQNNRWKAFIGHIAGSFTLEDSSGDQVYDWSFATGTGRIYATRDSGAVDWAGIGCANATDMESENSALGLTSSDDNITSTFSDTTHEGFSVGDTTISTDTCPTLNTFVNSVRSEGSGNPFEEMVLHDGSSMIFATITEDNVVGYNGDTYDFQMIVPENGTVGATGNILYYIYMELGN